MTLGPPAAPRAGLLILAAGLLVGLALGLVVFGGWPALPGAGSLPALPFGGPTATPAPAPVLSAPAPEFALEDLTRTPVSLSGLRGQVVLINFWATWCAPCRIEMPALQRRYEQYQAQGFTVLAVDADEPSADVSAFARAYLLTFPVLLDPGLKVNDLYRVRGYPTSYFVDRAGFIRVVHIGSMSDAQLDAYLQTLGLGG